MESYHDSVTPTDTPTRKLRPYEYVVRPPIARVLIAICQHCGVGGTIQPGVRQLAIWANFASAGRISPLLYQLQSDGWILYDPPSGAITLLADPDHTITPPDREAIPEGDQPISEGDQDAIPEGDQPIPPRDRGAISRMDQTIPGRDRFRVIPPGDRRLGQQDAAEGSITLRDRSSPRMEDHVLVAADRESDSAATQKTLPCEAESITPGDQSPAGQALAKLGFVNAKIIAKALAARPDVTPEHVTATWAYHRQREADGHVRDAQATFCDAIAAGQFRAPTPPPSSGPIDARRYLGGAYGDLFRLGSDDEEADDARGVA